MSASIAASFWPGLIVIAMFLSGMNWNEDSHELHLADGDFRRVQFLPRESQLEQVRWIEVI